ncbi:hypothetical protein HRR83_002559 [Exophiala dermatitidis]|uniref:Serine hydrolase domain-containing protein n=2 Tax=Exophiala dermatitidis TaxID=5970 RepID=H6BZJ9_EXODN|nr:uncharacterized protein HMPREF1120_05112 [Exophiala dermatitidis NIH/UT8656]KAJ4514472.1 hypothetical protein HRR73_005500 [Exophiala dermatitidis]EHY57062.1 hypothetical protein HMPREF1120_05112 [Exophiala dermatitidis NIH/UT8656]KAJ4523761.1 hypothetical protein HRR74_001954 [Exophiala dermatitidis]KAJ4537302.1 hypothetical protein HRR76_005313 [Exophiala dermatitidis]KAJ4555102.1 hypothetical protein HRR77_001045 [Exophiala dermatitidis]
MATMASSTGTGTGTTTTTSVNSTRIIPASTRPTHSSTGSLLPALLCLHGAGSNATVSKIQMRRLIWTLEKQFRFVFAEAPTEGDPGFGMLPVFESCAPFYRWVSRRFTLGESDVEPTPAHEVAAIDDALRKVMDANGGVESFKGVIGFSQGARVAAGLLLRQKKNEQQQQHQQQQGPRSGLLDTNFAFGVFLGGPYPPITLAEHADPKDYDLLKTIPTVHAWGRDDQFKKGCVELAKACESDHCFTMEYEGGHHFPLKDVEAKDLCDLIMAAWYAGGGQFGVAADERY